jgi:parallel beta-helix repeat protein
MDKLTRITAISILVFAIATLNAKPATSETAIGVVDGLELSITIKKRIITIGETINISLTLKNIGNDTVTLVFPTSQMFDVYLCIDRRPILAWSHDKFFLMMVLEITLHPGETFNQTLQWNFYRYDQQSGEYIPPKPGHYELMGVCVEGIWTDFLPIWLVGPGIIVPYDYPTIQEAINNASEGDAIFVSSGTYYENVVVNKTVSLIGEGKEITVIDCREAAPTTLKITASNVYVEGFTVKNARSGADFPSGIGVYHSNNVTLFENVAVNNTWGIYLYKSNGTTIVQNNASFNDYGIKLSRSKNCTIIENYVKNNVHYGIDFDDESDNGLVVGNTVEDNSWGISFFGNSDGSRIYHNNFINNELQVHGSDLYNQIWDNGCEGNYWSDYNGTDLDGDGVGDTYLPWQGVDYYPLMNPYWNPADINHDLIVDIDDVMPVALAFGAIKGSDPRYNPKYDFNDDGLIDLDDVTVPALNFGKTHQ